jgi:predicted ATP-dependent endonuclease of OLD family
MKISEVTIENLRSIRKATIPFHDYTAFVGPNGSGKSTVLTALRIFFRFAIISLNTVVLRFSRDLAGTQTVQAEMVQSAV